jgi:UDP-N-acetylglucosamine 2-epimerase (non-hydrolysing)/UDP-GlcNAc3NAcA epimerase
MIHLLSLAKKAITDSGGLQKEAYLLSVPCVTVREQTEWCETLQGSWNVLAKAQTADILDKVQNVTANKAARGDYYGDGHAAEKICAILDKEI